jgi:hypothetical protein
MNVNDRRARVLATLTGHGLSPAEHAILCQAGYRINRDPEFIVRQAFGNSEGDPLGSFTEEEYGQALNQCIKRGLLKLMASSDFDSEGRRTHLRDTPLAAEEAFDDYAPGHVEFTAEGYRVHRAIVTSIFDLEHSE